MGKIRKPCVAGQFYEWKKNDLINQIEECFLSEFGPGNTPKEEKQKLIRAVIVPHAGYMASGSCAAHAYKRIGDAKMPDVFLILGTNHSGMETALCDEDFETPFGIAKTDQEFVKMLSDKCNIPINNKANSREHSVEVQIPFLQYISERKGKSKDENIKNLKIAALLVSHSLNAGELGKKIAATIKEYEKHGKSITIIVSGDFIHYGASFGYLPFPPDKNSQKRIREIDMGAIKLIKDMDSAGLMKYVEQTEATICGIMPIVLVIEILNSLCRNGKIKAELLKYYTSYDAMGDLSHSVSYASILFE